MSEPCNLGDCDECFWARCACGCHDGEEFDVFDGWVPMEGDGDE